MRIGSLLVLLVLLLGLAACGSDDDEPESAPQPTTAATSGGCEEADVPAQEERGAEAPTEALAAGKTYELVLETSCGSFTITLDQAVAPKTAASLVSLARAGFFDGTTFHRVVPGFVIQGGDPTGTGSGGPGYQTVDTPPQGATYTQGVVAMAKTAAEPAGTAGSQFFVVTGADIGLPPDYAVVGEVTDGYETVEKIDALGVGDGPPSQPVVIEKVTVRES